MRQIVLSLSCCDLQAPLGQGRPCNLWTPLHIPVGAQGPTPVWAAFSKCFPHWPQDSVGKAAEVDS